MIPSREFTIIEDSYREVLPILKSGDGNGHVFDYDRYNLLWGTNQENRRESSKN
jgi:hypothetical protein